VHAKVAGEVGRSECGMDWSLPRLEAATDGRGWKPDVWKRKKKVEDVDIRALLTIV